jgi:hypothetical protein
MRFQEILEACWTGYQQQGMKKKGDRMVPVSEQEMEEDLKKWFKEKWVRFGPDGKIRGDCARGSSGMAYDDRVLAEKQDACYHKVKSRYKVWPSAYASGALVQCRKKGAANWGNKSK